MQHGSLNSLFHGTSLWKWGENDHICVVWSCYGCVVGYGAVGVCHGGCSKKWGFGMGDILTLLHERERKNGSVLVAMVPQEEHQVHLLLFFSQVLSVGFFMMRGAAHIGCRVFLLYWPNILM